MVRRPYRPHRVYALKGQINPAQGKAKRHPGLRDAKRKSPALCNPPPILLGQDGGRIAERGTADAAIRPRVPLRPGGRRSTLGWVDLPLRGASGTSHLFVESFAPPPPGVSPRAMVRRPYRPRGGGTSTRHNHQQPNNSTTQHASRHPYTTEQTTEHVAVRWSCCMRANTPISSYGYQPYGLDGSAHVA